MLNNVVTYQFGLNQGGSAPFDGIPDLAQIISFRKCTSTFTSPPIRVRNLSTLAEMDIPFSGDYVNVATLTAFASGADVGLVKGYDQSGNGRDVTFNGLSSFLVRSGTPNLDVNGKLFCEISELATFAPFTLNSFSFFHISKINSFTLSFAGAYTNIPATGGGVMFASEQALNNQPNAIITLNTAEQATKRKKTTVTSFGNLIVSNWNYSGAALNLKEDDITQTLATNGGGWNTSAPRGQFAGYNSAPLNQDFYEIIVCDNELSLANQNTINNELITYY